MSVHPSGSLSKSLAWANLLDIDEDGVVSEDDLCLALYMTGNSSLSFDQFEQVLRDPTQMERFISADRFSEQLALHPTLLEKEKNAAFLTLFFTRWITLSLGVDFFFVDHLFSAASHSRRAFIKYLKHVLGLVNLMCTVVFCYVPGVIIYSVETRSSTVVFQLWLYALYHSIGFCLPLAVGESLTKRNDALSTRREAHFLKWKMRYIRVRFGDQIRNGREAVAELAELRKDAGIGFSYVPIQFDVDVATPGTSLRRRGSFQARREAQKSANPFIRRFSSQKWYVAAGLSLGSLPFYPHVLRRESWPQGLDLAVSIVLWIACALGMYATFFANVSEPLKMYRQALSGANAFRRNTTLKLALALNRTSSTRGAFSSSSKHERIGSFDASELKYDLGNLDSLHQWWVLKREHHSWIHSKISYYDKQQGVITLTVISMVAVGLYISIYYQKRFERLFVMILTLATLHLLTLLRLLIVVKDINEVTSSLTLKDLYIIKFELEVREATIMMERDDDGDQASLRTVCVQLNLVRSYIDRIEKLEELPGRVLGFRVTPAIIAKTAGACAAAILSAVVRIGFSF